MCETMIVSKTEFWNFLNFPNLPPSISFESSVILELKLLYWYNRVSGMNLGSQKTGTSPVLLSPVSPKNSNSVRSRILIF